MNEELCIAMYYEKKGKLYGRNGVQELLRRGFYYTPPRQMERVIVTYEPDPWYFNEKPKQSVEAQGILSTSYSTIDSNGKVMNMGGDAIIAARYNPMTHYTSVEDKVWKRPLMLPQEVAEIPRRKVLVIYPGEGNYLIDRVIYFEQPGFKGKYRNHPEHPEPEPANDAGEPIAAAGE